MTNPYAAPAADFSTLVDGDGTYRARLFALNGRIGRVRYIAHSAILSWLVAMLLVVVAGVAVGLSADPKGAGSPWIEWTPLSMLILVWAVGLVTARRRFNDLGITGWCAGLVLVPFLNIMVTLWLALAGGNEGANEHGPAPGANSRTMVCSAIALPLLSVLLTVASLLFAR